MRAIHSRWFFPSILTLLLILLTSFSISGSSVGIYHEIFYGNSTDPKLLVNHPEAVRSDEWLVGTQKTIAQANNHWRTVNKNIGNGEDESVLVDNPTKNWSVAFRPENLAFFLLPFNNAFALRWWLPPYLLAISVYLFTLAFMPQKKLLASFVALGFVFSPFMQWWGAYMPAAWVLLSFVVFTKLFNARRFAHAALWGALLSYMAVCFALILYPPFQIPALFAIVALAAGYIIDHFMDISRKEMLGKSLILLTAGIIALSIVFVFLVTHRNVTDTIQNTAYPGHRLIKSGGYSLVNLLSGHLDGLLQNSTRATHYPFAANQSEASNFMLITPFIFLPFAGVIYAQIKKNRCIPYTLLFPLLVGILFMAWLFVPGINFIGKLTLLNTVPQSRLIFGIGILNLIYLVLFLRLYQDTKWKLDHKSIIIYSLLVMMALLCINFYVSTRSPAFMGFRWTVILSIPFTLIVYFLLRTQYAISMAVLCLFSFLTIWKIQPLYIGMGVLRNTPISQAMAGAASRYNSKKKWVTDYLYLENFAAMNGLPSLTGTYVYPQLNIWSQLHQPNKEDVYNRYAHITFTFDRNPKTDIQPILTNPSTDQVNIKIEPCDPFFKAMNVGYLTTTKPFSSAEAPCLSLAKTVRYPAVTFYIYHYSDQLR